MHHRQLIRCLKPIEGTIIQNITAVVRPRQLAPYCGRLITSVAYLPPHLRTTPGETVGIFLQAPSLCDEPLGLTLTSRDVAQVDLQPVRLRGPAQTRVAIAFRAGHVIQLLVRDAPDNQSLPSAV